MSIDCSRRTLAAILRVMHRFNPDAGPGVNRRLTADRVGAVCLDQRAITNGINAIDICCHVRPDKDAVADCTSCHFGKPCFRGNTNTDNQHISRKCLSIGSCHAGKRALVIDKISNMAANVKINAGIAVQGCEKVRNRRACNAGQQPVSGLEHCHVHTGFGQAGSHLKPDITTTNNDRRCRICRRITNAARIFRVAQFINTRRRIQAAKPARRGTGRQHQPVIGKRLPIRQ